MNDKEEIESLIQFLKISTEKVVYLEEEFKNIADYFKTIEGDLKYTNNRIEILNERIKGEKI